jgi:hypothetical protein
MDMILFIYIVGVNSFTHSINCNHKMI